MLLSYQPVYIRSYFSLLAGCLSPEEICRWAKRHSYNTVGMVDINNFYGLMRFMFAAEREGLKAVGGVSVAPSGEELFTAYVKNRSGFARINQILSRVLVTETPYRQCRGFKTGYCSFVRPGRQYGVLEDLEQGGWEGLVLVSDNLSLLKRLKEQDNHELFVKLIYGKSYYRQARWAEENGLPVMAVNEIRFFSGEDRHVYHVLRAIDLIKPLDELPWDERVSEEAFPIHLPASPDEMRSYFSPIPSACENAAKLPERMQTGQLKSSSFIFPGFRGMEQEETCRYLRVLCEKGIRKRYGEPTLQIKKRLDYELNIIRKKNFSSYFLVVHDIVSRCPRTCGRGSSASSIVSYLLGITHVDPLKYNLFFERFLNMGRKDPPDIDVDFPWDERDEVLDYVFTSHCGRSGVVANHVTFGPRSSLRETAKALGADEREMGGIVKLWRLGKEKEIPLYIKKIAGRIQSFPHYISLHCGGVVITPGPVTDYTHIQPSLQGYPVIAWEKEGTEEAGLVKIDLLGNRSLAVLRDALQLVNSPAQGSLPLKKLEWDFDPLKDRGTRKLIESGNTIGIFYVESPATRQLLKKMRHGDYERLVIASSIIRPAANMYIKEFVERLHGKPYKPLHPAMEKILKETFGIMVYQEDVSRVAIEIAGFSAAQADTLRKFLTKKDRSLRLLDLKQKFFNRARGIRRETLEKIWDMIASFKGYSFCKAHSASYALVSYKLAYLKRYFPLQFMISVIKNGGGFYTCQTYLNECRRMGFQILKPDVNQSLFHYSMEQKAIRIGFFQLKNLHRDFVRRLVTERKRAGPFINFYDFVRRCSPGLPETRILIRSGALDSISGGLTRPQLFWLYFTARRGNELFLLPPVPSFIGDYSEAAKLRDEIKTLGLVASRHPLKPFKRRIEAARRQGTFFSPLICSKQIKDFINQRIVIAGLLVTGKEVWTKNNEHMIFISFEDEFSIFETVLFPGAYQRLHRFLDKVGVFLISGKVEEEFGAVNINVENLVPLKQWRSGKPSGTGKALTSIV